MRHLLIGFVLAMSLPAGATECATLDRLTWMLGSWQNNAERSIVREHWVRVSDDSFEGSGETVAAATGERRAFESLRLVHMRDGIFYLAKTGGNDLPIAFALTHCEEGAAVFENPQHDFPRRIAYRWDGESLKVEVSDGDVRGFGLTFTRSEKDD